MVERDIIIRLKQGDKDAFEALYNSYWMKVYKFTQLYITSTVDVSEVVQEVFVKLWESRHLIDEDKRFEGFLFIVTRNLIFNYSRSYFNLEALKVTVLRAMEDSYSIEEELDAADLKRHIDELISFLPPRQQEVFRMSREQHMSNREIATQLSIAEKSVERSINLSLKYLRKNLSLFLLFISL